MSDVPVVPVAGSIDGIRGAVLETLKGHDGDMGLVGKDSLSAMWEMAWQVRDANDFINSNLRQVQVMVEDLYRTLLDDRRRHGREVAKMRREIEGAVSGEEKVELVKILFQTKVSYERAQAENLKLINALMKTSRELANEIRQSAMARRFNVHISEVKKLCLAFRAVLHQEIHDVNMLAKISEGLDATMKKIFPVKAEGEY